MSVTWKHSSYHDIVHTSLIVPVHDCCHWSHLDIFCYFLLPFVALGVLFSSYCLFTSCRHRPPTYSSHGCLQGKVREDICRQVRRNPKGEFLSDIWFSIIVFIPRPSMWTCCSARRPLRPPLSVRSLRKGVSGKSRLLLPLRLRSLSLRWGSFFCQRVIFVIVLQFPQLISMTDCFSWTNFIGFEE